MSNLIEDFITTLGPEISQKMSKKTNLDEGTIKNLVPVIMPMILGGLKKQKDEHGGEARVDHILNKYGSSSALDNMDDLFDSKLKDNSTDPNLGGLIGGSGTELVNQLTGNLKMDSGTASKLIPMLAPVVLGFLSKKRDSGAGVSGLAGLIDKDGDGSVLDDVAGLLLGGGKSSNLAGNILGGLTAEKK